MRRRIEISSGGCARERREDLWYRLNVLPSRIPPLRLRREDIPSLVQYFVERKAQEMNLVVVPRMASHELERLKAYEWPGNVRAFPLFLYAVLGEAHSQVLGVHGIGRSDRVLEPNEEFLCGQGDLDAA